LAGSYYVESLTNQIEVEARALIEKIERQGGMLAAIETGWAQRQIADAAYEYQRQIENAERVVVGVNRFVEEEILAQDIHHHQDEIAGAQTEAVRRLRSERDSSAVERALSRLREAATGDENLVPILVDTGKSYATIGEICGTLRNVFGEYQAVQVY
ncbi:MAG: methylmalonyl-CoA mutase, partial [Chloroflexi bacterium]|nr:methylmalonyl-CoA mutase [Chloroflexota bacterium]